MGLFFQRKVTDSATAAGAGGGPLESADAARTRARQRLIGAVVLLMIGVIGFPLIFESQPRPLPVDIPIEIPRKEGAPALALPGAKPTPGKAAATASPTTAPPTAPEQAPPMANTARDKPATAMITESQADAGREVPAPPVAKAPESPPGAASPPATAKPVAPAATPAAPAEGARAQALLDGKSAASTPDGAARFIVQVGAFADPVLARETRMKIERLGLKTYTQIADTAAGKRIRVRVGPFATRADADKVIAKTRAAGLPAAVLTL